MRSISLIALPYDSARFNERMGRGPTALLDAGLAKDLQGKGFKVEVVPVRLADGFYHEGRALVELQRLTVPLIRDAISKGSRPVLLSGNCSTAALSAVSAFRSREVAVVWFDAHGDFNTPETSASGFLDGMALAILTGRCWSTLAENFEDFQVMPEKHIIQIGVRNTDPKEEANLDRSTITRIGPTDLGKLQDGLNQLPVRQLYVHVDVDVLDPSEGDANSFACPGGITLENLIGALEVIGQTATIVAGSVTAYDPIADRDGRIGRAIPRIVELLAK